MEGGPQRMRSWDGGVGVGRDGGHIGFSVDLVGVGIQFGIGMKIACTHNIS